MESFWLTLLPFAFAFLWVAFASRRTVPDCPVCGRRLPVYLSPFAKSARHWERGGYLCGECGCETDLGGNRVERGATPRYGWLGLALGLPAVAMGVAFYVLSRIS